jgi:23S rRNA (pseudouridine1915-N3)-methyltransferase
MHIHLLAVGSRMPGWVNVGFKDYARRLPPEWRFTLREIPASKRRLATPTDCVEEEGRRLLAALPKGCDLIALHEDGKSWNTVEFAARVGHRLQAGRDVGIAIGGADGLASACIARACDLWSLSRLTLPHGLVRVMVAEQLYRASTVLSRHPYHRE